jgi:hypothetical protein
MPRRLTLGCLSAAAFAALALAQPGPTKADLEQQRKAAEKSLADRTREYDQVRKDARGVLADDFEKYEAKQQELQALQEFQRRLLDEVMWCFPQYAEGKLVKKDELLTYRRILDRVEAARVDRKNAINKDREVTTEFVKTRYEEALGELETLVINPRVKVGTPTGVDPFFRTYDELATAVTKVKGEVEAYAKKLGAKADQLAAARARVDATAALLAELEGRLAGKWKLDKVFLLAEKQEHAAGPVMVWNKKTDIYWKTDTLTTRGFSNQGKKYLVTGEVTPPPAVIEAGRKFDITFHGRLTKGEEDVGWPGVLLQVLYKYVPEQADSKVKPEVYEGVNATFEGKNVEKVFWEVNPKRPSPTDKYSFFAPSVEKPALPLWQVVIRGWNTPEFAIVYQYKMLK